MKKYTPNLNKSDVRRTVENSVAFVTAVMSDTPRRWSKSFLEKHLPRSNSNLGRYLRNVLLVCSDNHYSMDQGIPKEYRINKTGITELKLSLINNIAAPEDDVATDHNLTDSELKKIAEYDQWIVSQWVRREFSEEIENLNFHYEDKSNRLWHNLQFVKREFKKPILASMGLVYDYDISSAAPTLLLQHAQHHGMTDKLSAIEHYISNKKQVRSDLAHASDSDIKTIKVLVNSLFCGARLGTNSQFALYNLFDGDVSKIEYLKQDQFISELRDNIKLMWNHISKSMYRDYKLLGEDIDQETGEITTRQRLMPITSRQKWNRYFELERRVLNSIRSYLDMTSNRYFLEHDGFVTENPVDLSELYQYVFEQTKFKVLVDLEVLSGVVADATPVVCSSQTTISSSNNNKEKDKTIILTLYPSVQAEAENRYAVTKIVTPKQAMTPAERARLYRQRKKQKSSS